MLSGVQTGNGTPHGKYDIRGIAHARTNIKDNIFMQRRLMQNFTYIMQWGQGTCTLTKRTRRWTYSALRHFLLIIHIWLYKKMGVSNKYKYLYSPGRVSVLDSDHLFSICVVLLRHKTKQENLNCFVINPVISIPV